MWCFRTKAFRYLGPAFGAVWRCPKFGEGRPCLGAALGAQHVRGGARSLVRVAFGCAAGGGVAKQVLPSKCCQSSGASVGQDCVLYVFAAMLLSSWQVVPWLSSARHGQFVWLKFR